MARVLCALALLFLGFAHQPPARAIASQGDPSLADIAFAYSLPDGSIADLCAPEGEDGKAKMTGKGCEACRICADMLAPAPGGNAIARPLAILLSNVLRAHTSPSPITRRNGHEPRAPPHISLS
jgi:hypothetical protein